MLNDNSGIVFFNPKKGAVSKIETAPFLFGYFVREKFHLRDSQRVHFTFEISS